VNAQVDDLITTVVLRRVLAFTELRFSNSMIEAWWRSLKHQWLFLHPLDSVTTVQRLVEFYVHEHNCVLPHSAFRGQTPDEMYFGTGDAVPAGLTSRAAAARGPALRPTDRRPARRARQSRRPHDHRELTALRHRTRASEGNCPGEVDRAVARLEGQNRVPGSASLSRSRLLPRLNDENSRAKVQNVRRDSSGWTRACSRGAQRVAACPGGRPRATNEIEDRVSGSSGWTRTSNPPVNRLMQVLFLDGSSVV
jgi:hypothetical protein